MASTRAILFGYVVLHLYGNLKLFAGPQAVNGWWVFLRVAGALVVGYAALLWAVRVILLLAMSLHVVAAYQLSRRDRAARPARYTQWHSAGSTHASRTMGWSGLFLLLFILYHIGDLTLGSLHPTAVTPYREGTSTAICWVISGSGKSPRSISPPCSRSGCISTTPSGVWRRRRG